MGAVRINPTPFRPGAVPVSADEVRVWTLALDEPPLDPAELQAYLSPDERERAARYRFEPVRRRFVVGRGLLRQLLGWQLDIDPRDVAITYTGAGKPVLADGSTGLHFNVTHSEGLALIALARSTVGIDLERVRVVPGADGLVRRFFSPRECETYLELPEPLRPHGFFRGWTCKEAIIKAVGLSVMCLDEFDVELHPQRPAALLEARHPAVRGGCWRLTAWEAAPGFAAAVALRCGPA